MSAISASYQPNKIKRKGYTSWIDESNQFCTTTTGITLDKVRGQNLMDAFDVDWSAYKIDGQTASAQSIINKLNTPATAINNFLGVLLDQNELLKKQDRSTKEGSYWIVGADIDVIVGEKTYKQLHAGDQVIINVGAHDEDIEDASGFEECYYCVQINMSGYLPLTGGTMQGSINFQNNYTKIYSESDSLKLCSPYCVEILASELHVFDILPHNADSWNLGQPYMAFNNVYSNKFIKPGSDNNFVLLAGGGTKALSEIMPDGYKMARWDEAVSWGDHAEAGYVTSSGITRLYVGNGLLGQRENGEDVKAITSSIGTISLKTASNDEIGGIRIGYQGSDKNYPVQLNNNNQAFVYVPWTDTQQSLDGYLTSTEAANTYVKKTGDTMSGALSAEAFYETSDIRKKDIKSDLSLDKCYDLIDKCQTVIYSLKDQTKEQVGMIAQEIEEFFPEVVATDEEGFKSLAYDRLVVICFKVLKDVIKRLEKLEHE